VSSRTSATDIDTFDSLVSSIYDAAVNAKRWPLFVQRLAHALNAPSCLLRVQDLASNQVGTYITHGLDPEFQKKYTDYYVHIDPLMTLPDQYLPGTVIQTATCMPESFRQSEFYNEYALPQGMEHILGSFPVRDDARVAVLGVQRPASAGQYQAHEVALLDRLMPHLQRAIKISRHLMQVTAKAEAACDVLNRMSVGVILVDTFGSPVFVNGTAEAMMRAGAGLSIVRNNLQAPTWADTLELQRLIAAAASGDSLKISGSMLISGGAEMQPWNILVAPVNRENTDELGFEQSPVAAALFISTSDQQVELSLTVLQQLYGFTPAEARLAAALANGQSLDTIAVQFMLSKNTLRSQLKSCFNKTGTVRQAELVKIILCNPAALLNNTDLPLPD